LTAPRPAPFWKGDGRMRTMCRGPSLMLVALLVLALAAFAVGAAGCSTAKADKMTATAAPTIFTATVGIDDDIGGQSIFTQTVAARGPTRDAAAAQTLTGMIAQKTATTDRVANVAIKTMDPKIGDISVGQYRLLAAAYNGSIVDNKVATAMRGSPGIVASPTATANDITGNRTNADTVAQTLSPQGGRQVHKVLVANYLGTGGAGCQKTRC